MLWGIFPTSISFVTVHDSVSITLIVPEPSFALSIHAIKIVNNFGNAKAFGILILSTAVVYAAGWAVTLVL